MNELVSVLLPVYTEPIEWINIAINSIIEQTYKNVEIILIVDEPNRNDLDEMISSLEFDKIRVYRNTNNIGLVDSLNKGIEYCNGKYIARMDADDISCKNRLQIQMTYLKNNGLDLVAGNIETFNDKDGVLFRSHCPNDIRMVSGYIKRVGSLPHPTWVARKQLFTELGGYRHIEYVEDYDFLMRAVINGYKVGCVKEICLKYRQNLNGISQKNKGKQKYLTLLLQEYGKKNKICEIEDLNIRVEKDKNIVEIYTSYYAFSRSIRNSLHTKNIKMLVANFANFRISFLKLVFRELSNNILRNIYCMN